MAAHGRAADPDEVDLPYPFEWHQYLEQVRAGFAWHYKKYQKEQTSEDRQNYSEAEETAREARRGLWQEREPLAPWEWRAAKR